MKKHPFCGRVFTRFMRMFFYLLYQPLAWRYDLVAALVSGGQWKDWVLTVLPHLKGPGVLELGHGPGHLQMALHEAGIPACGLDASPQMGHQAQQRIRRAGFTAQLSRSYAQALPFPAACFEQVVATFPTAYIYAPETLAEIYRVLKPGGKLVVLPAAWITGKGLADRGTAGLFKITGQAPTWNPQWLAPLQQAGYQTQFEMITRKSWSLVILLGYKKQGKDPRSF